MRLPNYLPVEVIFNLLCVCRYIQASSTQSIRRIMYRRGLFYGTYDMIPDFGFWISLCQSAALLDEAQPPRPTLLVPDWLALPWHEQFTSLIEAWQRMPANANIRIIRSQLIPLLLGEVELSTSYLREISGLVALGLCEGENLTYWGFEFLTASNLAKVTAPDEAWQIISDELHVPYPPAWNLLWDLEYYLTPIDPGVYPLDDKALRKAVQRAENGAAGFLQILEQGISSSLPEDLVKRLEIQPTLKVLPGLVLEFSSLEELAQLRQNTSMRKSLSAILSPHHVYVDTWQAERVLKRLQRGGLLSSKDILSYYQDRLISQTNLSISERSYLLSVIMINDGMGVPLDAPPGLFAKLADGLAMTLRAAAARKADAVLKELAPQAAWVPEEELPPIPDVQTISLLEDAIQKGHSVDILYKKADQYQPDHRRVTPLAIEQRGLRFYLIAYCHTRRAKRTFRIDRLQLLNEPPQP